MWTTPFRPSVRTCTQERGGERLFYSLRVDSRKTKSEREAKDHLEKTCSERERNKAGWKSWNVAKPGARDRECWSENVLALCAYWRGET